MCFRSLRSMADSAAASTEQAPAQSVETSSAPAEAPAQQATDQQQQPAAAAAKKTKRTREPKRAAGGGAQYSGTVLGSTGLRKEDNLRERETRWDHWESEQDRRLRRLQKESATLLASPRKDGSSNAGISPTSASASPRNASTDKPQAQPPALTSAQPPLQSPRSTVRSDMPIPAPTYAEDCRQAAQEWLREAQDAAKSPVSAQHKPKVSPRLDSREPFTVPVTHDAGFPRLSAKVKQSTLKAQALRGGATLPPVVLPSTASVGPVTSQPSPPQAVPAAQSA
jgi:hypothetical protein